MRTVSFKYKTFKNDSYIVYTDDKQKDKRFIQTTDKKTNGLYRQPTIRQTIKCYLMLIKLRRQKGKNQYLISPMGTAQ